MVVNIILPVLARSGGADVVYKYAGMLTERGHDVTVYKPIWSFNYRRYSSGTKNRIHQLYCTAKNLIRAVHKDHLADKFVPLNKYRNINVNINRRLKERLCIGPFPIV